MGLYFQDHAEIDQPIKNITSHLMWLFLCPMENYNTISILGCGWLGYPLAKELISQGLKVKGSTTSPDKTATFQNVGITPYLFSIDSAGIGDISGINDFFSADLLIITLPPKIRKKGAEHGIGQIEKIRDIASDFEGKVIYTSSTSVYPANGKNHDEASLAKNFPAGPSPLLKIEEMLKITFGNNLTILRLGGLFGYDRIPVKYFLGKKEIVNRNFPVNYLHRDDAVKGILTIIGKQAWGRTYNVVSPLHPTREEVFSKNAKMLNVKRPEFSDLTTGNFKIINPDKMMEELGFAYQFPDPLDFSYNPEYKPL